MEESERQELIQFYHDAFVSAIESGAFEDIEEIWTELANLEPDNTANFLAMAAELESRRRKKLAGELLLSLARLYREAKYRDRRATALKQAARLLPGEERLKEEMAEHYRELHADHPLVEQAIRKSGLLRPMSINETMPRLELFLKFREGDIVNHPTGWGIGRVKSIDLDDEVLTVDFGARKDHSVSLDMAAKILDRVPPDSLMAQKFGDLERLKKQAASDPVSLIKAALNELGGTASLRDIKSRLTDGVVEPTDWSRWWAAAKKAAMKDPYLAVSGGAQGVLELRDEPISHQEEILEKLRAAKSIDDKTALVSEYTGNLRSAERTGESLGRIAQALLEAIEGSNDAAPIVQISLVLDDLKSLCPGLNARQPDLQAFLTPKTALKVVRGMSKGAYKRRALLRLKEMYPDAWPDVFSKLFFDTGSDLCDFAAKELLAARKHGRVSGVFADILARSEEDPEAYLWLCRAAFTGKYPAILGEHSKVDLVERLLALIDHLARSEAGESKRAAAERKKLLAKTRDTISSAKHIQQIIEDSSQEEARRVYHAARMCRNLTDTARDRITNIIIAEHPGLAPPPGADMEEDVIYTTADGLRRKQAEFDRVMNKEIPENQEALRIAISFGDLSENAEYSAAREQQSILMKKAERIKKELTQAKLIDPETVRDDVVSIGTAIEVKNTRTKKNERYTILGPWDSDVDNGIVSYLAPLAAVFLGKAVGDSAVLDLAEEKSEYEIISIAKVL